VVLEALELEFLRPTACQFGLDTLIDRLRNQNLASCCRRLRAGREDHNGADCSQIAVRAAEFAEAKLTTGDPHAHAEFCAGE
jgi:hypothetical protein